MTMPTLCDYIDAYILDSRTTTTPGEGVDNATKPVDERNKIVIFKNIYWLHKQNK